MVFLWQLSLFLGNLWLYIYIMIYYYSHVWTNLCIIYIYILLYITVSYYILLYMMIYHYKLYIVYIIIILSIINCYKSHEDLPTGGVPKKNAQSGFHWWEDHRSRASA
jgi:hypothetical protein